MRYHRPLAVLTAGALGASCLALGPVAAAVAVAPVGLAGIQLSEIESNGGEPGDWIELFNAGSSPVDLSGAVLRDSDDSHSFAIPAGTVVAPGAYVVFDEVQKSGAGHFDFGLGKDDRVRLFDAAGALVEEVTWSQHAATTLGRTADGDWRDTSGPTKGAPNTFADPATPESALRLSEVDSQPADWVELVNTGTEALDISGFELRDNSDDHSWKFPAGSTIAAGAYLVVDETSHGVIGAGTGLFPEAIGIGSADQIRLFDPAGVLLDDTGAWTAHATLDGDAAKATLARCELGTGPFVLAYPTPGAANQCVTGDDGGTEQPPLETAAWPGSPDATAIDTAPMFLEDSSGLDTQETADGTFLWAVDNGEGRFWKLRVAADGSATFAPGWETGKRARFQKDAEQPRAAGPDTEGITVADDGFVYLASERDNSAKGVNFNVVLQLDPEASGPDVVATTEWDLTALLPQVSANLGIEAVEWVADADLAGKLVDANTGTAYDPARYPLHGGGLFFVAVEDGGQVFAFALNTDGTAQRIAEVQPGLPGVMALDWDTVRGGLWAVCDDGCDGASAFLTLNGTETPDVAHFARPANLPNTNNEGFATAPASLASAGSRPAWWFTDGVTTRALHVGALSAPETVPPTDGTETPGTETPGTETPGTETPGTQTPGTETPGTQTPGTQTPVAAPKAADARAAGTLAKTGGDPAGFALLAAAVLGVVGTGALAFGGRRSARGHARTRVLPVVGD